MHDTNRLYRLACDRFGEKVAAIGDDQWTGSTPCTDWDVRALVGHLVWENAWIPPLLAGKTIAEAGGSLDGDLLGDDPKPAWRQHADAARAAVSQDGALDRMVHISRGSVPGSEYVFEVLADLTIHGWDLATAIALDRAIDPELLDVVEPYYAPLVHMLERTGAYGSILEPPTGADRQTRLLGALGRRAW